MINIARVLFLVDGSTEIRAFNLKFQNALRKTPSLRNVGCNGRDVSPEGYASNVTPMIQMAYSGPFNHFICVVDLERRRMSPSTFAKRVGLAITTKLATIYNHPPSVTVCVPDIMFENWIVADIVGIKKQYPDLIVSSAKQAAYDGKSGATALRKIMKVPFKKVRHGETLFNAIRFGKAKRNSPSFSIFCKALSI